MLVPAGGLMAAALLALPAPALGGGTPPDGAPGTPPGVAPPGPVQKIVIAGVPSGCVRSDFVARISLQPPEPPTGTRGNSSTRVTLDRREIRTTPQASFGVRIRASRLRPGLHRIGVSTTGSVGNVEELRGTKRFRRC
jgi:hypothetical protein